MYKIDQTELNKKSTHDWGKLLLWLAWLIWYIPLVDFDNYSEP